MRYELGVDIGDTVTTAALTNGERVEAVKLTDGLVLLPSVAFHDGSSLQVGEVARQRAITDPSRAARAVVRRFGDPVPVSLGGARLSSPDLLAAILRAVVLAVSAGQLGPPESVTLAHPARWGPYRRELLLDVAHGAGIDRLTTISSPEAAALLHASTVATEADDLVAVYDFGGETFEATVLRPVGRGFELAVPPGVIDDLGGADIDGAVLRQVTAAVGGLPDGLDPDDPSAADTMERLRAACRAAKETLSTEDHAFIPVTLPGARTRVRITRAELQTSILPILARTVATLREVVDAAGTASGRVRSVLLVGGSSAIPLVAEMVSAEFGLPVHRLEPSHAVAMGAARAATVQGAVHGLPRASQVARATSVVADRAAPVAAAVPPPGRPAQPAPPPRTEVAAVGPPVRPTAVTPAGAGPASPRANDRSRRLLVVLVVALVVALMLVAAGHPVLAAATVVGAGVAVVAQRRRKPAGH